MKYLCVSILVYIALAYTLMAESVDCFAPSFASTVLSSVSRVSYVEHS